MNKKDGERIADIGTYSLMPSILSFILSPFLGLEKIPTMILMLVPLFSSLIVMYIGIKIEGSQFDMKEEED